MLTSPGLSDEELVRLYVNTQQNTYFELLYIRYYDRVFQKCRRYIKDSMEAQDMAHDIFLKLTSKLSNYRQQAKFSTWLYTITWNYCFDQLHNLKIRQELFIDCNWELSDLEMDDGTSELAEQEALLFERVLQQLPAIEQTMLKMKYQESISVQAIASAYGLTEASVKMRLMRSRNKLRTSYLDRLVK